MHVMGAGVGRTGTYSLKLAINRLGLGPCHHMEAVIQNKPVQVPLWQAALDGRPDWSAIFAGFESAVDWPTAAFFRELAVAFPSAKFILTHREPQSWAESFAETIQKAMAMRHQAPPELKPWLAMASGVVARSGFTEGLDHDSLVKGFIAHNQAVQATIPASRLLVYQVKDGWAPLCSFLGLAVPDEDFPRTNSRLEFWERFKAGP